MKLFHLIFGAILFLVFITTGRYMRWDFPDKDAIDQGFRILMRSRHIYILFSALIHLSLGAYFQFHPILWKKILQIAGSGFLVLASILLIWAFINETYYLRHFSDLSRFGIYLSLAGISAHLLSGLPLSRKAA